MGTNNVKRDIIIGILIIIVAAASYWLYMLYRNNANNTQINAIQQAGNSTEDLGKRSAQGVLPSIDPQSNPMESAPDINPVSKTNPFSDIKTNPFR